MGLLAPRLLTAGSVVSGGGGGSTYHGAVLADTPSAYWRLGDSSGTTMTDSSGNSRSGTYNGTYTLGATGLVTGDTDTALSLAGTGYAQMGALASWMYPTTWSVEAIIKPTGVSSTQEIVCMYSVGSGFSISRFALRLDSAKVGFYLFSGSGFNSLASVSSLTAGTKYHLVATYDGTTRQIFLNGTLDASDSPGTSPNTGTTPLSIGGGYGGSGESYSGILDEVAFYGAVLSSTRIAAHAALV